MRYLLIILFLFSSNLLAENYTQDRCLNFGKELAPTYYSKDFDGMHAISAWVIKNCSSLISTEDYLETYGPLILSLREKGFLKESIKASEDCLSQRYDIADCHVEKFYTLKELHNKSAYQKERLIALQVVKAKIDEVESKKQDLLKINSYQKNENIGYAISLSDYKLQKLNAMYDALKRD